MSPHKRKAILSPWVHDQGDDYFDAGRAATRDCADSSPGGAHGGSASSHAPESLPAPLSALAGGLPAGRTGCLGPWESWPSRSQSRLPVPGAAGRAIGPDAVSGLQSPTPDRETRGGPPHRPLAPHGPSDPAGRRHPEPPAPTAAPLPPSAGTHAPAGTAPPMGRQSP